MACRYWKYHRACMAPFCFVKKAFAIYSSFIDKYEEFCYNKYIKIIQHDKETRS